MEGTPNTIVAKRPLPSGRASFQLAAGLLYQSFRSECWAFEFAKNKKHVMNKIQYDFCNFIFYICLSRLFFKSLGFLKP
jgi:hypothetical protein